MLKVQHIETKRILQVDNSWISLLQYIQENPFCEMTIKFKDGKPYEAEKIKESVRFR